MTVSAITVVLCLIAFLCVFTAYWYPLVPFLHPARALPGFCLFGPNNIARTAALTDSTSFWAGYSLARRLIVLSVEGEVWRQA